MLSQIVDQITAFRITEESICLTSVHAKFSDSMKATIIQWITPIKITIGQV